MASVLLLVLVCLLGAGSVVAQPDDLVRFRVAVLDFDVNDLTGAVSQPERLGRAMATEFETPLVQSRRFVVLTRSQLDRVLGELALADEGILNPEQVREFGELAGVDVIITGNITVFSPDSYGVSAQFIDVSTGELSVAETARASSPEAFLDVARQFVERAVEQYPLRGSVFAIDGEDVFIDVGQIHGLTSRDEGGVLYREREMAGRTIPRRLGTFVIRQIFEDATLIVVQLEGEERAAVGDRVSIQPLPDPSVGTEPPPSAARDGLLVLTGTPFGAEVLIDERQEGRLGADDLVLSLPAGTIAVRVSASGFAAVEEQVVLQAGETTRLEIALLPSVGGVAFGVQPADAVVSIDGAVVGSGSVRVEDLPAGAYEYLIEADGYAPERGTVDVLAGTEASVTVELAPLEATVVLAVTPADAIVLIDGVQRAAGEFTLAAGTYPVRAEAPGFEPIERTLDVSPGEVQRLQIALLPSVGGVAFGVQPADAIVSIDGAVVGSGSLTIDDLPPGTYEYRIEAEGFDAVHGRVEVVAGTTSTIEVRLQPSTGRVVVDVDPPTAQLVVGVRVVQSPFDLPEGRYELAVRADGYLEERLTLDVIAGETLHARVTLVRRQATIMLDVTPSDAVVRLDGVRRAAREFTVEPGIYALEVTAAGFEPFAQRLIVTAGQIERLEVRLEPEAATLALNVDASEFSVRVDEREVGFVRTLTLPAGTYQLRIEAPGRVPSELSVTLAPGESRELGVRLTRERAFTLDAAVGTEVVARSASGASIPLGTVDESTALFTLPEGRYDLRLYAPEDAPWRSVHPLEVITLDLTGDAEAAIELRAPGYLSIDTDAIDTVIVLDEAGDEAYRGSPAAFVPLAAGEYEVRAASDDTVEAVRVSLAAAAAQRVELVAVAAPAAEPDAPEAVAPAAPSPVAATSTERIGVVRFTSNIAPARVLLSGPSDEEVVIGSEPVDVELRSGLYLLRAEAFGARPLDDALAVSEGEVLPFDVRFADERILAGIGSISHAAGVDTLLVVRQEGFGQASARVEVRGPSGWNQDRTWYRTLDLERPYYVLEGIPPIPGTYRIETELPGAVTLANELTLAEVSPLAPTERLRLDAPTQDAVRATWNRLPDALSYEMLIGTPNDPTASLVVRPAALMVPSARLDRLDLIDERPIEVCVTSLTWDATSPAFPTDGVVAASRACESFTPRAPREPRQQRPPPPPDDPLPPPPPPPPPP